MQQHQPLSFICWAPVVKRRALALLMVLSCKATKLLELMVKLHQSVILKHLVKLSALICLIDTSLEFAYTWYLTTFHLCIIHQLNQMVEITYPTLCKPPWLLSKYCDLSTHEPLNYEGVLCCASDEDQIEYQLGTNLVVWSVSLWPEIKSSLANLFQTGRWIQFWLFLYRQNSQI